MDTDTKYVVMDEHTLGYINPAQPRMMGILHASVLRGSPFGRLDGVVPIGDTKTLRPATVADFAVYRVVPPPGFAG